MRLFRGLSHHAGPQMLRSRQLFIICNMFPETHFAISGRAALVELGLLANHVSTCQQERQQPSGLIDSSRRRDSLHQAWCQIGTGQAVCVSCTAEGPAG